MALGFASEVRPGRGTVALVTGVLGLGGPAVSSRAFAQDAPAPSESGSVRSTHSMGQARASHTATALHDGSVLIVGGFTRNETELAGVERFDPRNERFERIAEPPARRHSHTATRLADGRVLIAGGQGEGSRYLGTAELYDPATRSFAPTGPMTTARSNHIAVLLPGDRVLLVGGTGTGWTFLASAEIFDSHTGGFTATGDMGEPREGHAAARLADGRVLVTGGHRGRGSAIVVSRTSEIHDAATGAFVSSGAMTMPRHKHDAVTMEDGRVLVLGGADERDNEGVYASVEIFDPITGTFRKGSPMLAGRYKHRGTSLPSSDGRWILTGGSVRMEVYDPITGTGAFVGGSARLAGQFSAAASLPGGRVLITGGYGSGRGPRADAWIYEP